MTKKHGERPARPSIPGDGGTGGKSTSAQTTHDGPRTEDTPPAQPSMLAGMSEGSSALIVRIMGGKHMRARLAGLGLHEGSRIRLLRAAPFSGPLLVEDLMSGARVMIGRGMASSIEVRHDPKAG